MRPVIFDGASHTWLLSTPGTSYVIRLDDSDVPRQVHWGRSVTLKEACALGPGWRRQRSSFEGTGGGPELTAEGGAMFGVAGLQVHYADGARGVEWRYVDHAINEGHLSIRFTDRHYPLEITLHYRVFADTDVMQRWMSLRHTGSGAPMTLLRCDSASFTLPTREGYRVSHAVGGWSSEYQIHRETLPHGETTFTSRRGITSHQANPWLMLDSGDAGEEHGEVWSAALAWSGSWRITVQRSSGGVDWTGGFGHDGISWQLRPGEEWETPVFAGLYAPDGFGGTSRGWHAYALGHVLPHPDEVRPIIYNSWEATGFDVSEDGQARLARAAASLGVELFVMDDGWFGARSSDHAGLGDWTVNREKFPGGLAPLVAEVHRLGMRFGLWVEPEMVNPDSDLYRQRPDWVLHMPNRRRTELRNQLVLNFARDDVATWAHAWLDGLVADNDIDFLKWDANRSFTEAGWPDSDDPDRLWVDHTRNVYAVIDRLRADHPGLRIEACSGGGGRADLGMLGHTDQVWISDNTDAVDRIEIQYGYSQLYPARTMSAWVTDSPNPLTGRVVPLRFRFHVAMAGVLAIGGSLSKWTEQELAEAGELVARYKSIRSVIQHGRQHRLAPPGADVAVVQYVGPDGRDIVVLAWRPSTRFGHPPAPVRLAGLESGATYDDPDTGTSYPSAELAAVGLPLSLPAGDYASAVVRLRRRGPDGS